MTRSLRKQSIDPCHLTSPLNGPPQLLRFQHHLAFSNDCVLLSWCAKTTTMAEERTPLISIVETRPARDRYPHHTLRGICTASLLIILVVGGAAAVIAIAFSVPSDEMGDARPELSTSTLSTSSLRSMMPTPLVTPTLFSQL